MTTTSAYAFDIGLIVGGDLAEALKLAEPGGLGVVSIGALRTEARACASQRVETERYRRGDDPSSLVPIAAATPLISSAWATERNIDCGDPASKRSRVIAPYCHLLWNDYEPVITGPPPGGGPTNPSNGSGPLPAAVSARIFSSSGFW